MKTLYAYTATAGSRSCTGSVTYLATELTGTNQQGSPTFFQCQGQQRNFGLSSTASAGIFQYGPPGQGSEVSTKPQRVILFRRRIQGEQRTVTHHSVRESGRFYTEGVQGGQGSEANDAPAGVTVRAGI